MHNAQVQYTHPLHVHTHAHTIYTTHHTPHRHMHTPHNTHTYTHRPPSGASPIDKLARLLRRESADKVTQRLLSHSLRHTLVTEMAFLKRVTVCLAAGTGGHTVTVKRQAVHVRAG